MMVVWRSDDQQWHNAYLQCMTPSTFGLAEKDVV
jgi:hypothetical protein